jgi:hypothetical protein
MPGMTAPPGVLAGLASITPPSPHPPHPARQNAQATAKYHSQAFPEEIPRRRDGLGQALTGLKASALLQEVTGGLGGGVDPDTLGT